MAGQLRINDPSSTEQWIAQYGSSHQHPVNRACHTLGIPTILLSLLFLVAGIFLHRLLTYGLLLFVIGWIFSSSAMHSSAKRLNFSMTGGFCSWACAGGGQKFTVKLDLM